MISGEIEWLRLACAYALFLAPLFLFWYYRTGLIGTLLVAIARMTLQLLLVGLYLEFLFRLDHPFVNLLWVLVMLFVASGVIVRRSELSMRYFLFPVFAGLATALILTEGIVLSFILQRENLLEAAYVIPITGMILGNCLSGCIIALRSLYSSLEKDESLYFYALASGADRGEALFDFIRDAVKDAFQPLLASLATIGLIHLPGMMTGQILGGANPATAIQYQIMIMISVSAAMALSVFVAMSVSGRFVFDEFDILQTKARRNSK